MFFFIISKVWIFFQFLLLSIESSIIAKEFFLGIYFCEDSWVLATCCVSIKVIRSFNKGIFIPCRPFCFHIRFPKALWLFNLSFTCYKIISFSCTTLFETVLLLLSFHWFWSNNMKICCIWNIPLRFSQEECRMLRSFFWRI